MRCHRIPRRSVIAPTPDPEGGLGLHERHMAEPFDQAHPDLPGFTRAPRRRARPALLRKAIPGTLSLRRRQRASRRCVGGPRPPTPSLNGLAQASLLGQISPFLSPLFVLSLADRDALSASHSWDRRLRRRRTDELHSPDRHSLLAELVGHDNGLIDGRAGRGDVVTLEVVEGGRWLYKCNPVLRQNWRAQELGPSAHHIQSLGSRVELICQCKRGVGRGLWGDHVAREVWETSRRLSVGYTLPASEGYQHRYHEHRHLQSQYFVNIHDAPPFSNWVFVSGLSSI